MSVTATAPPSGWVRLSERILLDGDFLALDAVCRLVFLSSLPLAGATDRHGEISMRAMVAAQHGALEPDVVIAAGAQLVEAGLWSATDDGDRFVVTAFLRWHPERTASAQERSVSASASARERKSEAAHRTNHKRGFHKESPRDECPLCPSENASERSATGERALPLDAKRTLERSKTRQDKTRQDHHPSSSRSSDAERTLSASATDRSALSASSGERALERSEADDDDGSDDQKLSQTDPAVIHLADALMDAVGQIDTPAGEGLRQPVADALNRLWPAGHLRALAAEVGSDPDVKKPVKYLIRCVKNLAAEDPPVPPLDPWDYPTGDDGIQVAPPDVVQAAIRTARANITTGDHP